MSLTMQKTSQLRHSAGFSREWINWASDRMAAHVDDDFIVPQNHLPR